MTTNIDAAELVKAFETEIPAGVFVNVIDDVIEALQEGEVPSGSAMINGYPLCYWMNEVVYYHLVHGIRKGLIGALLLDDADEALQKYTVEVLSHSIHEALHVLAAFIVYCQKEKIDIFSGERHET